jgi:hypothetical protein
MPDLRPLESRPNQSRHKVSRPARAPSVKDGSCGDTSSRGGEIIQGRHHQKSGGFRWISLSPNRSIYLKGFPAGSKTCCHRAQRSTNSHSSDFLFFYIFYLIFLRARVCCVGHSFDYVAHILVLRDVWIRAQRAAMP